MDDLGEMMDVAMGQVRPVSAEIAAYNQVVNELVLPDEEHPQTQMLQVVNIEQLRKFLQETAEV